MNRPILPFDAMLFRLLIIADRNRSLSKKVDNVDFVDDNIDLNVGWRFEKVCSFCFQTAFCKRRLVFGSSTASTTRQF